MIEATFGLLGIAGFFGLVYYLVWLFVPRGEGSF